MSYAVVFSNDGNNSPEVKTRPAKPKRVRTKKPPVVLLNNDFTLTYAVAASPTTASASPATSPTTAEAAADVAASPTTAEVAAVAASPTSAEAAAEAAPLAATSAEAAAVAIAKAYQRSLLPPHHHATPYENCCGGVTDDGVTDDGVDDREWR